MATDPEIRAAFEDCLRHDRDRELQRTCLEAYLDAAPAVSFDVLIDVVADEGFDLRLRGRTLAALEQLAEDPDAGGERRARLDELSAAGRLVGIDGRTT